MSAGPPGCAHVTLNLRDGGKSQPRLGIVVVARENALQLRARLGKVVPALQDRGVHEQRWDRRRRARQPGRNDRLGTAQIACIAGVTAIVQVGLGEFHGPRHVLRILIQRGAQRRRTRAPADR